MNNKELLDDLYEAIEEDNLKRVEYLISKGVNVDKIKEGTKELPLFLAIILNRPLIVEKIIKSLGDKIKDEKYSDLLKLVTTNSKGGSLELITNIICSIIDPSIIDAQLQQLCFINEKDQKIFRVIANRVSENNEENYKHLKPAMF